MILILAFWRAFGFSVSSTLVFGFAYEFDSTNGLQFTPVSAGGDVNFELDFKLWSDGFHFLF